MLKVPRPIVVRLHGISLLYALISYIVKTKKVKK